MPFSLTKPPAKFQNLIDKIITTDVKPKFFAYLDDIIIVTEDFNEDLYYLNLVIDKPNKANWKCEFGYSQVKYLASVMNEEGLQVDTDKIEPIIDFPRPQNA